MRAEHAQKPEKSGTFPRERRLLKHACFDQVYRNGQRHFSSNLTAFFLLRPELEGPRVGFTVPRALGGAVARNRIKRRMREAVRRHLQLLVAPVDVVFNPKRTVLEAEFGLLMDEVARALETVERRARCENPERPSRDRRRSRGKSA